MGIASKIGREGSGLFGLSFIHFLFWTSTGLQVLWDKGAKSPAPASVLGSWGILVPAIKVAGELSGGVRDIVVAETT